MATSVRERLRNRPREHLAELVSAACYGSVLVLAALAVTNSDDIASGFGFRLVVEVGLATWVAHLFAHVVGDQLRHAQTVNHALIRRGMAFGSPILLATVLPAIMLGLGALDVLSDQTALWAAVLIAGAQLVAVGGLVGAVLETPRPRSWSYAVVTGLVGVAVVGLKVVLGH